MNEKENELIQEDLYSIALNLFEAAKKLKTFDILYADSLLGQAQYFLNLAENPSQVQMILSGAHTRFDKDLEVSEEAKNKIEEYSKVIKEKIALMKKEKDEQN